MRNTDCYFYSEEDLGMEGEIDYCSFFDESYQCKCRGELKNRCKYYFSRLDVYELVKDIVKKRKTEQVSNETI